MSSTEQAKTLGQWTKGLWSERFWASKKSANIGFHGGLALDPCKRALSANDNQTILELALPEELVIPLVNYEGTSVTPQFAINDHVERGQLIAAGIAAPASGTVNAIETRGFAHPGDLSATALIIKCDKEQPTAPSVEISTPVDVTKILDHFLEQPNAMPIASTLVGLGGAAFPMFKKIGSTTHQANPNINTLIINAAECEPEIACDEALMHSEPANIAHGIEALMQLTQCQQCILAIEDSKPAAIDAMRTAIANIDNKLELTIIPTRYPTGAESPLIETLTGQRLPHGQIPSEHGIACVNVGSVFAFWQALSQSLALDSRVVSLGGSAMENPCNVRVRFGTPISFVLQQTNNTPKDNHVRLRVGGPLSGFDISTTDIPLWAKTNCILAEPDTQPKKAQACIRCSQCVDVCPSQLLPQQLHWYAQNDELDKCKDLHLDACIECGCCDLVCPASIKLTETFRFAKSRSKYLDIEGLKAKEAEERFESREQRLAQHEIKKKAAIAERKKALKQSTQTKQPDADRIKAALERARSKRNADKE